MDFDKNAPPQQVGQFTKGDRLTADRLNTSAQALNRLIAGARNPESPNRSTYGGRILDDCDVVATSNVTLSGTGGTVDGHTIAAGDTVLATAQSTAANNGLWTVPSSGAWVQVVPSFQPDLVFVFSGTSNSNTVWALTASNTYSQVPLGTGSVVVVARVATSNIALTGTVSVDGSNAGNNTLVLAQNQTTTSNIGVWKVNTSGAWTKSSPFQPTLCIVSSGTTFTSTQWYLSGTNAYKAVVNCYA